MDLWLYPIWPFIFKTPPSGLHEIYKRNVLVHVTYFFAIPYYAKAMECKEVCIVCLTIQHFSSWPRSDSRQISVSLTAAVSHQFLPCSCCQRIFIPPFVTFWFLLSTSPPLTVAQILFRHSSQFRTYFDPNALLARQGSNLSDPTPQTDTHFSSPPLPYLHIGNYTQILYL